MTYERLQMAWAVFASVIGMVAITLVVFLTLYALYVELFK